MKTGSYPEVSAALLGMVVFMWLGYFNGRSEAIESKKPIRPEVKIVFDKEGAADTTYYYYRP